MKRIQEADEAIDVASWYGDEDDLVYPEGARDKTLLYSRTLVPYGFLKPNHRYLFKRSSKRYLEQFWVEILAYRLGCEMGITVPPAFVAYDTKKDQSGALIEWFYREPTSSGKTFVKLAASSEPNIENSTEILESEIYLPGGDYCQILIPEFDRKAKPQLTKHSVETISEIFRSLKSVKSIDWPQEWAKFFVFDALIGNTDRHQDNWGTITFVRGREIQETYIAPAFDNGTSMGHEISAKKFASFKENDRFKRYIAKGRHHMKWSIDDPAGVGHAEMLKKIAMSYPQTSITMLNCLKRVSNAVFEKILNDLVAFDVPVKLSTERAEFMLQLLQLRYNYLLRELEK